MGKTVAQKLFEAHRVGGGAKVGEAVAVRIEQTLCDDASGALVMLALDALGVGRVATEVSVQYVDHDLLRVDERGAAHHRFLAEASRRFGLWLSPPGNGVSHPLHVQRFGRPGRSLLGADRYSAAGGALGMLALAGGALEVALAMAGEAHHLTMPAVWGVRLTGELGEWVSAKDLALELLRRHGAAGGVGRIIEYYGPGVASLSVWDRHVLAVMGAELGAVTSVFPSDERTRAFLADEGRGEVWRELAADRDAAWDLHDEVHLGRLEPLVARPSRPDDVVPVAEVAGTPIDQAWLGSSANPGFRDFAVAAQMLRDRRVAAGVSLEVTPPTRQLLYALAESGLLAELIAAGARLHQAGAATPGQAPAPGANAIRTAPSNAGEAGVWLASPETVAASALRGSIADPRQLGAPPLRLSPPRRARLAATFFTPPPREQAAARQRAPALLPAPEPLPAALRLPVLLAVGDGRSTAELLPAAARDLLLHNSISELALALLDEGYRRRAEASRAQGGHALVAGHGYGQGDGGELATLALRHLGLRLVLARSFAPAHREALVHAGVLPVVFTGARDHERVGAGQLLVARDLAAELAPGRDLRLLVDGEHPLVVRHGLGARQLAVLRAGGLLARRGRDAA